MHGDLARARALNLCSGALKIYMRLRPIQHTQYSAQRGGRRTVVRPGHPGKVAAAQPGIAVTYTAMERQLFEMGFTDEALNARALKLFGGGTKRDTKNMATTAKTTTTTTTTMTRTRKTPTDSAPPQCKADVLHCGGWSPPQI
eukprot:COSAG05_NODE_149_length_16213_cov_66.750279_16_plen_143_part_00